MDTKSTLSGLNNDTGYEFFKSENHVGHVNIKHILFPLLEYNCIQNTTEFDILGQRSAFSIQRIVNLLLSEVKNYYIFRNEIKNYYHQCQIAMNSLLCVELLSIRR